MWVANVRVAIEIWFINTFQVLKQQCGRPVSLWCSWDKV